MRNSSRLNNNITVLTDNIPTVESVDITILIKTGSRHEEENISGVSHFLEHMAFKGTKRRTARQIAEEFDSIGGSFNAYTSRERTAYHAKVLKEHTIKACDIMADILQNSVFSTEEMERERNVILEELASTQDSPEEMVFDNFQSVAFAGQAIGRPIIGSTEFIKNATPDHLHRYMGRKYHGNNIIISAAGNIEHDSFLELVSQQLCQMSPEGEEIEQEAKYIGGESRTYKDLEQVHLLLGFQGASYRDNDYYAQQILAGILGGSMSSRLFQEIREKKGLVYSIAAFMISYSDSGIFTIHAATQEQNANRTLELITEELHKIQENITEDELNRTKTQVKASLIMSQESVCARAEKSANNHAAFGRYISIKEINEQVAKVDVDVLKRTADKIFHTNMKPTLASLGRLNKLYTYDEVCKLLNFKQ